MSGTTGALAGGVVWSASAAGGLYVGNTGGTRAFSTNNSVPLTFGYSYGPGVSGVGGSFYPTDINFNFVSAATDITVLLLDSTSQTFSRTISSASAFWGFHSNGAAIASITISVPTSPVALYPTVSNMSLMTGGASSPVPEIDPAGFAACFALVVGSLAAIERRVRRV